MLFKNIYLSIAFSVFFLTVSAQDFVSTEPCFKNVVLEELTGIYCTFCPDGHARANVLKNDFPGRVILVNIHAGSYASPDPGDVDFRTSVGTSINNFLDPSGYPAGAVNRRDHDNDGAMATGRGDWYGIAEDILTETSVVNIAAKANINISTGELVIDVEAYYTDNSYDASGDRLNVMLLQNNIEAVQVGSGSNPSQLLPNGNYNHQHALRHSFTGNIGQAVSTLIQGSLLQTQFTYALPEKIGDIDLLLKDIEVVAYIAGSNQELHSGAYAEISFSSDIATTSADIISMTNSEAGKSCDDAFSPLVDIFNNSSIDIFTAKVDFILNGSNVGSYLLDAQANPIPTGPASFYVPNVPINMPINNIELKISEINNVLNTSTNNAVSEVIYQNQSIALGQGSGAFNLVIDAWGSETTWSLDNLNSNSTVISGGPYQDGQDGQAYNETFALTNDNTCYLFTINDTYGDGICCAEGQGSYNLTLNGTSLASGGSFGSTETKVIKIGTPPNVLDPKEGMVENNQISYSVNQPVVNTSTYLVDEFKGVKVYPNPNSGDFFSIESQEKITRVTIKDLSGKLIRSFNLNTNPTLFSIKNIPSGIYFVDILLKDNSSKSVKLSIL